MKNWIVSFVVAFSFLALLAPVRCIASTYYVDSFSGNNSNSGLSPSAAWHDLLGKQSVFSPGDIIRFRRGAIWNQFPVRIYSSGTASDPIVITSYGAGPKPSIAGSTIVTSWTHHSGGVYKASVPDFRCVAKYDGNYLAEGDSLSGLQPDQWWYSGQTLFVNVGESPTWGTLEAVVKGNGLLISGDHVVVDGLEFSDLERGVVVDGDDVEIRNSYFQGFRYQAVWNRGGDNFRLLHNRLICGQKDRHYSAGCLLTTSASDIGYNEIAYARAALVVEAVRGPIQGGVVHHNWVHDVVVGLDGQGVLLVGRPDISPSFKVSDVLVHSNIVSDCEGACIAYMNAERNVTFNNVVFRSGREKNYGAQWFADREAAITLFLGCDGNFVLNNTLDDNDGGIAIMGALSEVTVLNNTISNSDSYGILVTLNAEDYFISHNNQFESGDPFPYAGSDEHSLSVDPGFVNETARDYRLVPQSPLRGAGAPHSLVVGVPDIGADSEPLEVWSVVLDTGFEYGDPSSWQ